MKGLGGGILKKLDGFGGETGWPYGLMESRHVQVCALFGGSSGG